MKRHRDSAGRAEAPDMIYGDAGTYYVRDAGLTMIAAANGDALTIQGSITTILTAYRGLRGPLDTAGHQRCEGARR